MTGSSEQGALTQDEIEPFVLAAHGDFDRMRTLLAERPALLNAVWERTNETAIQAAAHTGQRAIAEYLLAAGAPLDICTAAMLGLTDRVAAYLAEDPALANATGAHGISLLFHASFSGKPEIADLLVANGGGDGAGPALHAAIASGQIAMVRWLLAHDADVNTPNFAGKTPLQSALNQDKTEIADLLREFGGTA
jgi:ankyrin repeat protein